MLREDPAGVYAKMDFATRDHYRHVVEKLAKRTDLTRARSPRRCWSALARRSADGDADLRRRITSDFISSMMGGPN